MKILKRVLIAAAVAMALVFIPVQTASAYWVGPAPGLGPWRHAYVHDPNYRFAPPAARGYIRDLYLYGPVYAAWHQRRRYGWW
jgi:hypothetical protein